MGLGGFHGIHGVGGGSRRKRLGSVAQELDYINRRVELDSRLYSAPVLAEVKVRMAVDAGLIMRASACERCGVSNKRLSGHHEDYDKPFDVMWVCRKCHGLLAREMHRRLESARRDRLKETIERIKRDVRRK